MLEVTAVSTKHPYPFGAPVAAQVFSQLPPQGASYVTSFSTVFSVNITPLPPE